MATRLMARPAGGVRRTVFGVWVGGLTLLVGMLFVGVTLLTLVTWLATPGYQETNPVVDLGFFALGGVLVGAGLASQLRAPEAHVAGFQQAALGLVALAAAGLVGNRIEPFVGGVVFLAATVVAGVLHPARAELLRRGAGLSWPLAGLAALAMAPALAYATRVLVLAVDAGPSCFMGQCARGDRFAEVAALAIAVVLVAFLASVRTSGWRLSAWCAGGAVAILGFASVLLPHASGSLDVGGGLAALAWGGAMGAAAEWQARSEHPQPSRLDSPVRVRTGTEIPGIADRMHWQERARAHLADGPRNGLRTVAAALGVCVGLSGLDHGFFEVLQGDTPTSGLVIQAIGPAQRMWINGTEEAFTIVPNFLVTGVLAFVVGLATIIWSIGFIDRPQGARVLLLLGVLLFLVGGGIGMLPFLLFAWLVARRIHRLPTWWQAVVPDGAARVLSRSWPWLVAVALVLYAFALEIAIVGYVPGVSDADALLAICWTALLGVLLALGLAVVGASSEQIGGGLARTR